MRNAIECTEANIAEIIKFINSTYERYREVPKWNTLQTLFRLSFKLGYEYGRKGVFESMEISKQEER